MNRALKLLRNFLALLPVILISGAIGCLFVFIIKAGIDQHNNTVYIGTQKRNYVIIAVDPPKRTYVDIRDSETEQVFRSLYLGKRFPDWREKLVVGRNVQLTRDEYTIYGKTTYSFPNLKEELNAPNR